MTDLYFAIEMRKQVRIALALRDTKEVARLNKIADEYYVRLGALDCLKYLAWARESN